MEIGIFLIDDDIGLFVVHSALIQFTHDVVRKSSSLISFNSGRSFLSFMRRCNSTSTWVLSHTTVPYFFMNSILLKKQGVRRHSLPPWRYFHRPFFPAFLFPYCENILRLWQKNFGMLDCSDCHITSSRSKNGISGVAPAVFPSVFFRSP